MGVQLEVAILGDLTKCRTLAAAVVGTVSLVRGLIPLGLVVAAGD